MSTIVDPSYGLYSPEDAEAIASQLNEAEEDGWKYVACHDPAGTGQSYIEAYDEDGKFVHRMPKLKGSEQIC